MAAWTRQVAGVCAVSGRYVAAPDLHRGGRLKPFATYQHAAGSRPRAEGAERGPRGVFFRADHRVLIFTDQQDITHGPSSLASHLITGARTTLSGSVPLASLVLTVARCGIGR